VNHVPDSEGEDSFENGREKSPFEHVVDLTKRALAPATFYLRQRSQEPEGHPPTNGKDASYDYSAEEREFQAAQSQRAPASRRTSTTATHKRGRISTDNKAYRPSLSDLDDDDDDSGDDGKKGKKRKAKKKDGLLGGPLMTLPVAGYDKKKKKRPRGGKGNTTEFDDDTGSGLEEHASDQVSATQLSQLGTHFVIARICGTCFARISPWSIPATAKWPGRRLDGH
jgi:SUN domain-containing protein 1/2